MDIHVFYWFDGDEEKRELEIEVHLPNDAGAPRWK